MSAAQREPQPASFRHTPWRLGEVFLLLLAICAAVQVWHSVRLLSQDGENSFVEGGVALPALRLARGGPVYMRPDQPPSYTGTYYTPLFYISMAALDRLTRPATFQAFLFQSRLFVFLSYLLIALVVWRWARRYCFEPWVALAAPLLVLTDSAFYPYDSSLRPDISGLLFSLLGFFLITRDGEPGWGRVAWAGFLMGLGFSFKQSLLAAPAAAACWLLWQRRFRLTAVLATAAAVSPAVAIGWLQRRGEPVLYSLLLLRHTIHSLSAGLTQITAIFLSRPTVVLEIVLAGIGIRLLWKRARERALPVALFLAMAALVAMVTMTYVGSARYYMVEVTALCAILAPSGLEWWLRRLVPAPSEMRLAAALVLLGFPAVNLLAMRAAGLPPHYGALAAEVAGRRILSDVEYLAVQGKEPEMVDAWSDSLFERLGEWSPAPVLEQLRSQQFDYIILLTKASGSNRGHFPSGWNGIPDFSPSIVGEIQRDYRLVGSCAGESVVVFVPKQEPRGSQLERRLARHCGWR